MDAECTTRAFESHSVHPAGHPLHGARPDVHFSISIRSAATSSHIGHHASNARSSKSQHFSPLSSGSLNSTPLFQTRCFLTRERNTQCFSVGLLPSHPHSFSSLDGAAFSRRDPKQKRPCFSWFDRRRFSASSRSTEYKTAANLSRTTGNG